MLSLDLQAFETNPIKETLSVLRKASECLDAVRLALSAGKDPEEISMMVRATNKELKAAHTLLELCTKEV